MVYKKCGQPSLDLEPKLLLWSCEEPHYGSTFTHTDLNITQDTHKSTCTYKYTFTIKSSKSNTWKEFFGFYPCCCLTSTWPLVFFAFSLPTHLASVLYCDNSRSQCDSMCACDFQNLWGIPFWCHGFQLCCLKCLVTYQREGLTFLFN